jgi:hypothetical protein
MHQILFQSAELKHSSSSEVQKQWFLLNMEHSGCLSTSKTYKTVMWIVEHVHKNSHLTIHEYGNEVGISCGPCQSILMKNLNTWWITTKSVLIYWLTSKSRIRLVSVRTFMNFFKETHNSFLKSLDQWNLDLWVCIINKTFTKQVSGGTTPQEVNSNLKSLVTVF